MQDSLFCMQDAHPSNCLGVIDLTEIDLGRLQILVPQDNFRYDFQGHSVSTGIDGIKISISVDSFKSPEQLIVTVDGYLFMILLEIIIELPDCFLCCHGVHLRIHCFEVFGVVGDYTSQEDQMHEDF
jgi:hypothetical protein